MKIFSATRNFSSSIPLKAITTTQAYSTTHSLSSSAAQNYWTHLQENGSNPERTLHKIKHKLDTLCVSEVLKRCAVNQPLLGLRFFIWSGLQQPGYKHSSFMYKQACKLFKINENPRVVLDVVEAIRREGCLVSVKAFKLVLNLCREAKLANEGLWVLRKMKELNCRPDTTSYNVVIGLLCENGDVDEANRLIGEMGLVDLYPDMITYAAMVKGFCEKGRLDDACRLFKAMRGNGCSPNVVLYSTLLDGVCRFGSSAKALELLGEMEKVGGDCNPNVVTYTSVIQRFCERGWSMEALSIFDRMEACGCAPNRVTVVTLINELCLEEDLEAAYKLIDWVVERDYVSNSECYSSLVVSLSRKRKSEEAEKLFRRMLTSAVKPDGLASSIMIRGLCLEGRVLEGFYLYNEIEKLGCMSSIDSDIYSIVLVGLCKENHLVEAANLAKVMAEKGIQLKAPYVDHIVEYLKNSGETELVSHFTQRGRSQ
ncbi:hypothetical protein LguiB_012897 [Lonicera macranthoides]